MGGGKLITPYIVYTAVGILVYFLLGFLSGELNPKYYIFAISKILTVGSSLGNLPLWFLMTLFCVINLYNKHKLNDWQILCISILAATLLHFIGFTEPYYISNIMTGLAFYVMGVMFKEIQYNIIVLMGALVLHILILWCCPSYVGMFSNSLTNGYYILWFPFALSGIIIINNIFKRLPLGCLHLDYIGKRAMNYYVTHWIVIILVKFIVVNIFNIHDKAISVSILIVCLIFMLPLIDSVQRKYNIILYVNNKIRKYKK